MSLMEKTGTPVGSYAPDFELPGTDDKVHHLSYYLQNWQAVGVIFLSNCGPVALSYLDKLKQIQSQFQPQGFTLVGINANAVAQDAEESFQRMKQFAQEKQLNFPYLWDSTQDVAHCFGAENTPEAFLIDREGILRYHGRIDDNPQDPNQSSTAYLQNAIAALLSGQEINPSSTEVIGDPIKWRN